MIDLLTKAISAIFGTKADKDLKELYPYVTKINEAWQKLSNISNDQLRQKTTEFKAFISNGLQSIDRQIADLKNQVENQANLSFGEKDKIFNQIDKLGQERDKRLEELLLELLPEAFAVVKETARRFATSDGLEVTATEFDKAISTKKDNVKIDGDRAFWSSTWKVAGHDIRWEMVHYDVQLIGGTVLHQGKISEMATGEGKTLVSTLPAYLNALAGNGVHIVTVNDYLAKRDSEWNGPLFEFHGLTVDCIDKHQPNSDSRRQAYLADITYGTNNEFGFDYLRDNMAHEKEELVQRKLHFAMVDEVDSVLIDDARTPLIISGPMAQGDRQDFDSLKPRVASLVEEQKKDVMRLLSEAKKLIGEGNDKEGGLALFRAYRALPKYKPLIKYLSESGTKVILQKTENLHLEDNQKRMPEADKVLFFTIDEKNNSIDLTEKGIDFITGKGEDPEFFILPDIGMAMAAIENNKSLNPSQKIEAKDKLVSEYSEKAQRIHTVQQLLKAYCLFEKEVEYIIVEGKVKIVDEQTGRIMEGRRYSDGLHQALEAKENVKIEDATQTYATVTLQNYFRMYHKLAGMTGTAETEAGEFWQIYKLDVVTIPTNKKAVRKDAEDLVYKTIREKYNAVAEEIEKLIKADRPVLVGTTSVETSELLSRMLKLRNIKHQVLNAKYHQKEAEIVAEAGKPGTVTIATNMAGRGTDIKLTDVSRNAGGLAIIGTERHESRRVDRQLRGRSGRQGDPGSSQFFVSLEDDLMRLFGSDRISKLMDRMGFKEGEVIQHSMITNSIERAQKKVEENNFGIRKRLLEYDDVMNSQREVIYKRRRNALFGDRLELDIQNLIWDTCSNIVETNKVGQLDFEKFQMECQHNFAYIPELDETTFRNEKKEVLISSLFQKVSREYKDRCQMMKEHTHPVFKNILETQGDKFENVVVPVTDGKRFMQIPVPLKKVIETEGQELIKTIQQQGSLVFIDQAWKEHLRDMDDLKQSVNNAVYEQKDPLLVYKFEALKLFKSFIFKVNEELVSFILKAGIYSEEQAPVVAHRQALVRQEPKPVLKESRVSDPAMSGGMTETMVEDQEPKSKPQPVRVEKVANRNDRVSVRYFNGELKRDVKYKTVEEDILANRCVIVDL
jgi:preprotein translocase subunit SecA